MMDKKPIFFNLILLLLVGLLLTGCTQEASSISQAQELDDVIKTVTPDDLSKYYYLPVGTYDSADTAILSYVDTQAHTVTLYNTYAAKNYTLNYDGTTYVSDKYGTAMSMSQLTEGTIVNVNFLKSSKQLVDIQVSPEAWTYDNITKYNLNGLNSTAIIGGRTYALTEGVQVFSQGKASDLMSIVSGDIISISGIGYDIYSIRVENGHGYIRLTNDDGLIGGWIEVGNEVITQVSDGMLLAVPEGEYDVKTYNKTASAMHHVIVDRNQEVILDCSDITVPQDIFGRVVFNITPNNAVLYLDGEREATPSMVKTSYGIHQIEIEASGYDTLSKYINVGEELAEITIRLNKTKELKEDTAFDNALTDQNTLANNNVSPTVSGNTLQQYSAPLNSGNTSAIGNTASGNTTSGNTTSGNTTSGNTTSNNATSGNSSAIAEQIIKAAKENNQVYIYSPADVEVYFDGMYVGIAPINFIKIPGTHTLIFKREGFVTKSYTINLEDNGEDISISFSPLELETPFTLPNEDLSGQ